MQLKTRVSPLRTMTVIALLLSLVGGAVVGQGIGTQVGSTVALNPQTNNNLQLGCCWFQGQFWVSARGTAGNTAAPHSFYIFDGAGNLVMTRPQDPMTSTSTWGHRDGATDVVFANDGSGNLVFPENTHFWGYEGGIIAYDANGTLATTYNCGAGQGLPIPANPILGPGLTQIGNYRALAYNPWGNGGLGSFWSATFGSDMIEIDMMGNVLQTVPFAGATPANQWSAYGLALDPVTGNLWVNSSPNAGLIKELDLNAGTLAETGAFMTPEGFPSSLQGGLDKMVSHPLYPTPSGNFTDLAFVMQDGPDYLQVNRLHLHQGVPGTTENRLVTQVTPTAGMCPPPASPRNGAAKSFNPGDLLTLGWDTTPNPTLVGTPILMLAAIDWPALGIMDASAQASTLGGLIPELTIPSSLSMPAAMSPLVLGDGFGLSPLFGQLIPLFIGGVGGPDVAFPLGSANPAEFGSSAGDALSLQALTVVPGAPAGIGSFMATNRVTLTSTGAPAAVLFEAIGANAFNNDVTSGFWRCLFLDSAAVGGATITQLQISLLGAGGPYFDVDQGGMNDVFWGGNSTITGCANTYRNGCDVTTGLIYDAANTYNPMSSPPLIVTCDGNANCGFIAQSQGPVAGDWYTLRFRFNPGDFTPCEIFEFDCDTDGGNGAAGFNMAGATVTVTFSNGMSMTGILASDQDPSANRSSVRF